MYIIQKFNYLDNEDDSDKVSERNNESSGACGEDSIQDCYIKDGFKELRQEFFHQKQFSIKSLFEELRQEFSQEFRNQHQDFTLDVTEHDTKT